MTEHLNDAELLADSRHFLRSTLDALTDHIAVLDSAGCIILANLAWRQFAEQNGLPPERVGEGVDYLSICDQAAAEGAVEGAKAAAMIREIIAGQRDECAFEYPCHSPQEQRWFLLRASCFEQHGLVFVVVSHKNITERRRAEEALQWSNCELEKKVATRTHELQAANEALASKEKEIRSVIEHLVDCVISIDEKGTILSVNRAVEKMLGYVPAELIGRNVSMLMPEPHRGAHDGYLEKYQRTGQAHIIGIGREVEGLHKNGTRIAMDLSVNEYFIGGHRFFTGILHDITERKQAQAQQARYHKELADFKAALDEHAILATTDARGTITYVNDKFCAVSKYARQELIGQNHRIVNSGLQPKAFFRDLWRTIGSGNVWKGEIRNRARDGSLYWVDTTIVPFLDEHGKPFQYIAIRADITERKQAEQALVAARNEAELANRAKGSFLATMSHEIRTPLGGLMGMLELLSLSTLGDEQRESLETARDSGRSLLRILNDILDWSKIEEGKLGLSPQVTSIAGLVAEVANTYSHVASTNSVTLEQQVDERLSPAHIVDPLRLSQVLNNFVSNAIKFSHGGRVEVRAELLVRHDSAEQLRFSVKDTGIGIDPEAQQRLFQNYSQANPDTARMYGGTGLGLAICGRLADLLDGRIGLVSTPGQGSTFSITLTLPIAETVAEAEQGPTKIGVTASMQPFDHGVVAAVGLRILVVDDNSINRQLLTRQLGLFGLRAETAEDGEAALSLYRAGRFALIITDCHMPKMDGYALTRAIRAIEAAEACPRTPIFAWTANALAEEIENCQAAGMDELLVKPTELAQLQQMLARWLPTGVSASAETQAPAAVSPAPPPHLPQEKSLQISLARLDVSVLAALVGDDPAVIREFQQNFRTSSAAIAAEIRSACQAGQAAAAGAAAHKLKSSARSVGALRLGELCAELEAAGKAADDGAIKALLPRFEAEMVALDEALAASTAGHEAPQEREYIMTDAFEKSAPKIMLLDDDPFMLNLLVRLLKYLGFSVVSTHTSGYQALNVLDGETSPPDLILLDLNMPEMDGIEFVRHLVERRYAGSIVLLSGEDERLLRAASTLAQAQQINVLGHLHKPVEQATLTAVLAKWARRAVSRSSTAKVEYDADAVRAAIANGELVNYYQPTVAVADGRVIGVETLVRWRHPVDGLVFPDQFIGVAEAHGLIDDLTYVVLRAALAQARAWQDAGLGLRVAVNVSMDNLTTLSFADLITSAAANAGMEPSAVVLEVTESRLMADLRAPLEILTRLRLKRFRLSIDDFGTGHSSLAQLRDIPFDELKIDRSFVHGAHAVPTLRAIFEGNLSLARKLGIDVVAEGVEDRQDWDFLRHAGCDFAQGYFIARPMLATDFHDWIRTWESRLQEQSLTLM